MRRSYKDRFLLDCARIVGNREQSRQKLACAYSFYEWVVAKGLSIAQKVNSRIAPGSRHPEVIPVALPNTDARNKLTRISSIDSSAKGDLLKEGRYVVRGHSEDWTPYSAAGRSRNRKPAPVGLGDFNNSNIFSVKNVRFDRPRPSRKNFICCAAWEAILAPPI
jgi:hypothetical protein